MKNILIISSKKYTKLKTYTDLINLIKSKGITFETSHVEDKNHIYEDYINEETLVKCTVSDKTKKSWTIINA